MNEAEVLKTFKKQKSISKRGLSQQVENTESSWSFYNADQMTYSDRIQFEDTWGRKRRAMVNFNKVQQNVDSVVGFMAQNRRQAKFIAHVEKDERQGLYSKNMNALYTYHRENTNADQLETEQDLDMMVNGYGAIDTELSYIIGQATTMPNGEIVKSTVTDTCYWDPNAKGVNLLDRKWCGYHKDFELHDAMSLFQGSAQGDFETVSTEEPDNTGYIFNPYGGIYSKIKLDNTVEWASKEAEMVRVYNHQWMVYETFYKCANPIFTAPTPEHAMFYRARLDVIRGKIKLPGDTEKDDLFALDPASETLTFDAATKTLLVNEFGALLGPITDFKRKAYYTAVVSGDHVFTWFRSLSQTGFSIQFKTGTWNKSRKMWMGMVNAMMEPQKYFNKALTELMFTIAANSKGGVYVEEDAVEDIADFETKYAKTDGVIKVAAGALAAGKIQDKARPAVPTGLEGIIQLSEQNISANGVDPAFLGDIGKEDQSGVLYKRRLRQVISKFARYFDSIELYQKCDARLCADLIPVWVQNNQGEWTRITGPDGAEEFVQITEDMLAPEYDVTIQEAAMSSDQKQETAIMLGQAADKLLSVGDIETGKAFMGESLQFMAGLDGDVRARLMKYLQPQQQQVDPAQFQALQQQLSELQAYIQGANVEKTQSETAKNMAIAQKTLKDAEISAAKVPNTQADTALKLENAQKASVEAAVMVVNPDKEVQVQI